MATTSPSGDDRIRQVRDLARDLDSALRELVDIVGSTAGLVALDDTDGPAAAIADHTTVAELTGLAGLLGGIAERATVMATQVLVDTDHHRNDAMPTPSRWLEHHLGLSRTDALRLVRADRALRHLDDIRSAFHCDELRLAHLDSIARIVPSHFTPNDQAIAWDAVSDSQSILLDTACSVTPTTFTKFCQAVRDRLDLDGPRDRAAEPSRIWLDETFAGRWALRGDLNPDDGALLASFLDDRTKAILSRARTADDPDSNGDTPGPRRGRGKRCRAEKPRRPLSEVRADALSELARDGAGTAKPGRIGVYLHVDLADLLRDPDDMARRPAHTWSNLDISEKTMWQLMAGADITPVFWDSGQPLSYGRSKRCAPEILRQILAHRDRTCRFPTCDVAAGRTHAHHIIHFENGGLTDPACLVDGCTFHHHGHHKGHWTQHYDPHDNTAWATHRDGRPVDPVPRWRRYRREQLGDQSNHETWMTNLASRLATRGVRLTAA